MIYVAPASVPSLSEVPSLQTISSSATSSVATSDEMTWVSVAEAARRLHLDRSRVYTLVRSGELQGTTERVDGLRLR